MIRRPRCAALAATLALTALSTPAHAQELVSGVASGDVTQTTAIVWARGDSPGTLTFEISPDRTFQTGVITLDATVVDVDQPVKRVLRNLTPSTRYYLRVVDAGGARSAGTFVTSDDLGVVDGFRFGVTGDSRGDNAPYHGVTNVPRRKLDLFIELGDTTYADVESPILPGVTQASTLAEFRTKHAEILQANGGLNALVDVRRSTPMLATIDDHEVTNDFAGGADPASDPRFQNVGAYINETPLFDNGLRAFEEWHPIGEERYGDTGDPLNSFKRKLYRQRWYGSDAAIHILDARSFRDEPLVAPNPLDPADVARFFLESFDPSRTMLSRAQVDELKADLLDAQASGITWKFVMVPEPIQNLGPAAASDRFEGYAAERTEILQHIATNQIDNVVFVAADVHGTVINDLQYQLAPGGPQLDTGAFEVTTGAIAYDAPFGPTVVQLALQLGLLTQMDFAVYQALPREQKDLFVAGLIDLQTGLFGYTPVGLEVGGQVNATLLQGGWAAVHTWGWTEFDIAPLTQVLTVTTYGVDPFAAAAPEVLSRFEVHPR